MHGLFYMSMKNSLQTWDIDAGVRCGSVKFVIVSRNDEAMTNGLSKSLL
jgi:hypothetical protein